MTDNPHTPCVMTDTTSFFVRICPCGVVHLCFGSTTLNLSPQTVIAVTETLKEVSFEIQSRVLSAPTSDFKTLDTSLANVIHGKFPLNS